MNIIQILSDELHIKTEQVEATISLIDAGNTIPFIARYRKEVTGSLDDQILRDLLERLTYLRNLEKRKEDVQANIEEQGKLTDEIILALNNATTLSEVEDIYRPYKQKRKTRASVAREKGLEPLANLIKTQSPTIIPEQEALSYINVENGIETIEIALQGASDIIAEEISDDANLRKLLRNFTIKNGQLTSKAIDEETDSVYRNYYEYAEPIERIPPHRILALDRGEKEGVLRVGVSVDTDIILNLIAKEYVIGISPTSQFMQTACKDSYNRLISPSIEREIRSDLTEKACTNAIKVFSENLRQLLMQPPVKDTITLGLDPAYRTGCKLAVIDDTGKVLDTDVIYPTPPQNKVAEAKTKLKRWVEQYHINTIAIGNGTASRESEAFIAEFLKEIPQKISYMVVSEAGASVYSASKLASDEFPQFDVSLRSAVSIARRLQDPLAELVKIDPKAIGVGQYQHDMPKNQLDEALKGIVEDCVNSVGVDLNTASHSLLSYTAGISTTVAKNIVAYREEQGAFKNRKELLKVAKLGKKSFEQCAGFLRISNGEHFLDQTAVHPESYAYANKLIKLYQKEQNDINTDLSNIQNWAKDVGITSLAQQLEIGEPTLRDILNELIKPGRDPRDELPPPLLRSGDIMEISDLKEGMELMGTVRNIVDFGAFVDIGVHEDGLVHISQLADKYVKHPLDIVKVGNIVKVRVLEVDTKKNRIALTMRLS